MHKMGGEIRFRFTFRFSYWGFRQALLSCLIDPVHTKLGHGAFAWARKTWEGKILHCGTWSEGFQALFLSHGSALALLAGWLSSWIDDDVTILRGHL